MSSSPRTTTRWWRWIAVAAAIAMIYSAIGATRAWSSARASASPPAHVQAAAP